MGINPGEGEIPEDFFYFTLENCIEDAEQGNADAQFMLAEYYKDGIGIKQDYKKAAEWYSKAAEQGDEMAKNALENLEKEGKFNLTLFKSEKH